MERGKVEKREIRKRQRTEGLGNITVRLFYTFVIEDWGKVEQVCQGHNW